MDQLISLTIASLKMFYRNKIAIYFSLFVPLLIIVIFGFLVNNTTKLNIAIVDNANNTSSQQLVSTIKAISSFNISSGSYDNELSRLKNGDEDLVIVIPDTFNILTTTSNKPITAYYDKAKQQNSQPAILVLNNILTQYNEKLFSANTRIQIPQLISLSSQGIETNNLSTIDFLIPGIIAMSIMQMGLFSVSFAFTTMKKTGALKRLQATPAKPLYFLIAQSIARIILSFLQVGILLGVGLLLFKLHMYGSILLFMLFALLGGIVFLAIGFAIAGYSKDENQAAPITNLISLPMLFLSGVFFPRSAMPDILKHITDYLPLTYLADALRQIANNGAGFSSTRTDLIGLIIWAIIAMIIAVRLFKWE